MARWVAYAFGESGQRMVRSSEMSWEDVCQIQPRILLLGRVERSIPAMPWPSATTRSGPHKMQKGDENPSSALTHNSDVVFLGTPIPHDATSWSRSYKLSPRRECLLVSPVEPSSTHLEEAEDSANLRVIYSTDRRRRCRILVPRTAQPGFPSGSRLLTHPSCPIGGMEATCVSVGIRPPRLRAITIQVSVTCGQCASP